jgi:hypothetical protein
MTQIQEEGKAIADWLRDNITTNENVAECFSKLKRLEEVIKILKDDTKDTGV